MRVFIFILILSNLVVFAWAHDYLGESLGQDTSRLWEEIRPESIRLLASGKPPVQLAVEPVLPVATPQAPPAVEEPLRINEAVLSEKSSDASQDKASQSPDIPVLVDERPAKFCLIYKDVPITKANLMLKRLSDKFKKIKPVKTPAYEHRNFWVHIPPLANRQAAEAKTRELKAMGVTEYFISPEGAENSFAISLGVFSSRESAEKQLAALRAKGVVSAKVSERGQQIATLTLELEGQETERDALQKSLAAIYSATKPLACTSEP